MRKADEPGYYYERSEGSFGEAVNQRLCIPIRSVLRSAISVSYLSLPKSVCVASFKPRGHAQNYRVDLIACSPSISPYKVTAMGHGHLLWLELLSTLSTQKSTSIG